MAINREVRVDFVGRDRTKAASASTIAGIKLVNKEVNLLATRAVAAQRAFSALTIGFAGVNAIKTLGDLQESMLRVRNTSLDYAKDQQFLGKTTRALNLDLQAAAESFADILVLQNTGFISGNQAQSLFIGFQETAKKFGVGAEDIKFALRGIRQAMAAGVIRAQEFDQIFDAMPTVMNSVARNLGLTTQELLELRTASSLSSKTLIEALIPALREADGSAAKAAENINASLTNLASSYKRALLAFEEPIGDAVGDFADLAGASIDRLVENSEKIKYVGIAIAAAFGGRALQAIYNANAAQRDAAAITSGLAKEVVALNTQLKIEAVETLRSAKAAQIKAAAYAEQLTAQVAGTKNWQAQTALANNYRGSLKEVAAANRLVAAAEITNKAATDALTASQRAAGAATIFYASTLDKLKGVLKANWGFAAVGALLLMVSRVREGTKEVRELENALEDLDARYSVIGKGALDDLSGVRQEAEIKLNKLQVERLEILAKQEIIVKRTDTSLTSMADNLNFSLGENARKIHDLRKALELLRQKESEIVADDAMRKRWGEIADSIEDLNRTAADYRRAIPALIDEFIPSRGKIRELEERLLAAKRAFTLPEDKADRKTVIDTINAEIGALDGSIKANKAWADAKEKSRLAVDALNESLLTERDRIEKTFKDAKIVLKVAIEKTVLTDTKADAIEDASRQARDRELRKLDKAELDRVETHRLDMKATRDKVVQDRLDYNNRLIAALTTIDPYAGEAKRYRAALLRLNSERETGLAARKLYNLEVEAEKKRHDLIMAGLDAKAEEAAKKTLISEKQNAQNQLVGQIASNFVSAFEQQVGAYQVLTDNMTDIERDAAVQSNKINKKKFEQNKKFAIAQAIISTLLGASNALAVQPTPFGIALAASVIALGMRNVANIRSSSFGSGASISTGGGAPSTPAAVEPTVTGTATERIIMIVAGNFQSEEEAMAEVARRQRDAYQQGLINLNPDGSPDFRNVPDRVVHLR